MKQDFSLLEKQMMTLSAIAYAGDTSKDISVLKAAINTELQKTNYATNGDWHLAWGPVLTTGDDNLMFIAGNGTDFV